MELSEFLKSLHNDKIMEELIPQLRREKIPLVMWGCGNVADSVFEYLCKEGIKLSGVLVDIDTEYNSYNGIPIYNREKIIEKFDSFNVILGHSQYEKGECLKSEITKVNKVFYVFSVTYRQYDRTPYEEIEKIADRYVRLCNDVEDEQSVKNLLAYLNTRITGDVRYIFNVYKRKMNFYNNDIFRVTEDEVLIDIGAYDGDTIRTFLKESNGKYKKIIALEPDDKNFLRLNNYIAKNRMTNVVTSKIGAWNCRADLKFEADNEQFSGVIFNDDKLQTD